MSDVKTYLDLFNFLGSKDSNIVVRENFIKQDILDKLMTSILSVNESNWENDINLKLDVLPDSESILFKIISSEMNKEVASYFNLPIVQATNLVILRYKDSDHSVPPHYDDNNRSSKNYFSSLLYLNDDYQGGEIYFPQYNKTIKPKSRSLIFFPGNSNYVHGVNQSFKNNRYALLVFHTINNIIDDNLNKRLPI
jgi:hypothetical protein